MLRQSTLIFMASNEVPEYTGGADFVLAAPNDLPEYKGGVNGAEAVSMKCQSTRE